MWLPRVSVGSSSWSERIRPAALEYCSALRMRPAERTGLPSSVKPTAPHSASSTMSVSSLPSSPREIEAKNPTGTLAFVLASSTSAPKTAAESMTGSVLGIARIAQ